MTGKDYLNQLLHRNNKALDDQPNKKGALIKLFQYMVNKANSNWSCDPLDVMDELRVLVDITRDGISTKPKLYRLYTTYEIGGVSAIVLAYCETEARLIASAKDDRFLEDCCCDLLGTSAVGIVEYNRDYD